MNEHVEYVSKSLNGMEYGDEISKQMRDYCRKNNIVVFYGYSDDVVIIDGMFNDEVPHTTYFLKDGLLESECNEGDECPYFKKLMKRAQKVVGRYNSYWEFETDIDHGRFNMYEDGQLYCVGIVFSLKDVVEK